MRIAHIDDNDCNFVVEFKNETDAPKVREAIKAGISAWYEAAHDTIEDNEYWDKEEIISFYNDGYAEPTVELLDRWGIEHKILDVEYDRNDNVIGVDDICWA